MANVSGAIKSIQDIMRKDAGVDGDAQRIGQLVWMFFLKILDDQEESLMLLSDDYRSPIPDHLRWSAWATDPEGITGEALLDFVNNQLFPKLKNLPLDGPERDRARVVRTAFEDAYNYMKNGTLIRQVVNKINEIDFNNTGDKHAFGDVYEQILKDLQSAGNSGEFYTPRAITQFMVDMLDPQLEEVVLDPACGTGGFLAHVIDHKSDRYVQTTDDAEALQKTIIGVEKKALPHLLCVTNMMLHGIEAPNNILHDNTLATPLKDHKWRGKIDVIVTNPPFGGIEEDGIEKNVPQAFQTRETADLFLVLIIELLKDGGRAAVVLPDGTLFGEGIKTRIKEKLMAECNLHTIVRLPNGVFNPYTGIKTNLLFFDKGKPTEEVWFYEHPYPEGYKNYSKTKPMRIEEFESEYSEKAWWGDLKSRAGRVENDRAWRVSADQIKANGYNLDIANPHRREEGHRAPSIILSDLETNRSRLASTQSMLKSVLAEALPGQSATTEVFLKDFATLTSATGGVQRLRDLVLQLAMRGKLVRQSASDGLADSVLSEIERDAGPAVKKRWEKYGAAKPIFSTPDSWKWTSIGRMSRDWGQKVPEKAFRYIDVGGIDNVNGQINQDVELIQPEDAPSRARKVVKIGTVIYSTVRPYLKNIAIFDREFSHEAIASTAFAIVHPLGGIRPEFVFYYLRSRDFVSYVEAQMMGVAYPAINDGKFFAAPIPLPPLREQDRIVAAVQELMRLCDQLGEQLVEDDGLNSKLLGSLVHSLVEMEPDDRGPSPNEFPQREVFDESEEKEPLNVDTQTGSENSSSAVMHVAEQEALQNHLVAGDLDNKFKEASLVGAIVNEFFKMGGEPIGNFRLQKAVYFARRHNGEHVGEMGYLRKAAGPYNPSMKYSGGIAIAKQKNWLREARGRFGFGHMPGASASEMDDWIEQFGFRDAAQWVADRFRFKKNEEWEILATVDYAIEHLQSLGTDPDAAQILQFIEADEEWRPKIEKLRLTETSVEAAMIEVKALFGVDAEERA